MKPEYPKRMVRTRGHSDSVPADQAWARDAEEEEELEAQGFMGLWCDADEREEEERKEITELERMFGEEPKP